MSFGSKTRPATWWPVALHEIRHELKDQEELIDVLKAGGSDAACSISFQNGMNHVLKIIEKAMDSEEAEQC